MVLGVACGSGVLSIAAAQRRDLVAEVIASDLSPAMCQSVEKRHAALAAEGASVASLRTLVSDACHRKDVLSASVDASCIFGIMLLPDPEAARKLTSMVQPGGPLVFPTWMPQQSQLHGVLMTDGHRRGPGGSSCSDTKTGHLTNSTRTTHRCAKRRHMIWHELPRRSASMLKRARWDEKSI